MISGCASGFVESWSDAKQMIAAARAEIAFSAAELRRLGEARDDR